MEISTAREHELLRVDPASELWPTTTTDSGGAHSFVSGMRSSTVVPPHLILLAGVALAFAAQGGYYRNGALAVAVLVASAAAARLRLDRQTVPRRPTTITIALAAMALWATVAGVVGGQPAKALPTLAVIAGCAAAIMVVRRTSVLQRDLLVTGMIVLGAAVAASGWLGVVFRAQPWAHPDGGLWRAATSITYANAAAAVLSTVATLALARIVLRPSAAHRIVAFTVVVGLGATVSRAGIVTFLLGCCLLVLLLGPRRVIAGMARTLVGAGIAVAGLLPSMPVGSPVRPSWAAMALAAGVVTAAVPIRRPRRRFTSSRSAPRGRSLEIAVAVAATAIASVLLIGFLRHDAASLPSNRLTLASPDRTGETRAAMALTRSHLLAGVGPGAAVFIWSTPDHRLVFDHYAHDEYLQLAAEQGLVGVVLLLALGVAVIQAARRGRVGVRGDDVARGLHAGAIAALGGVAVHSGFDFLWHVPAVALVVAVLIGLCCPIACPLTAAPEVPPTPTLQEETI